MNKDAELAIRIPDSEKPRVVIIGGGFAGINLAKTISTKHIQVVMVDRNNYHTFQPLLYQVATAGLEPDSIAGPLRKILESDNEFYFRMAQVTGIDPDNHLVKTSVADLHYDYLVIASGSRTNYFGQKQIEKLAFPLKQIPHALDLRSHILQNFEKAVMTNHEETHQSLMNFVVVGGGPTGVEVSGALGELKLHVLPKDYPDLDFRRMEIYLIEGLPRLLNGMSESAGQLAYKYLKRFDVNVYISKLVTAYDGKIVSLSDGSKIPSQTLIWAAGVTGNLIEGLGEDSISHNRIRVDEINRVVGHENIFAIGDIATMETEEYPQGHPMLASVACQQGTRLGKNLLKLIKNQAPTNFKYWDKGTMATIGRNRAVVDLSNKIKFGGLFAWFIWMFVHLILLVGYRNRLVVLSNWMWNYFTYDRGTRLIIRPFVRKTKTKKANQI